MIKPPAISSVHAVLDRSGLVKRRKRRRHKAQGKRERSHVYDRGLQTPTTESLWQSGADHICCLCPRYGSVTNGALGRIRTCDLSLRTTIAFTTSECAVCGLDFTFTLGRVACRCCPSSLYTFSDRTMELGSVLPARISVEVSPNLSRFTQEFPHWVPNFGLGGDCSIP